jgi:hypothetical protein
LTIVVLSGTTYYSGKATWDHWAARQSTGV